MEFPTFGKSSEEVIPKESIPQVDPQPKQSGCETCANTGLEQGVPLSDAKICPVCQGSPFGVA